MGEVIIVHNKESIKEKKEAFGKRIFNSYKYSEDEKMFLIGQLFIDDEMKKTYPTLYYEFHKWKGEHVPLSKLSPLVEKQLMEINKLNDMI